MRNNLETAKLSGKCKTFEWLSLVFRSCMHNNLKTAKHSVDACPVMFLQPLKISIFAVDNLLLV